MGRIARFLHQYLTAVAVSPYLFSVGLLSARNRGLIRTISSHFGASRSAAHSTGLEVPSLPSADLSSLGLEGRCVSLLELAPADGNVSVWELVLICQFARRFAPRTCFEIGTFDGRTALNLAANTPEDALILTLDLPPQARATASLRLAEGDARFIEKDRTGARFSGSPLAKKIRQLHGDSATFDFSPYFGAVDLVFVDGSHSYEYAIGDSLTAMKLVRRPSGLILWHDYGHAYWPGVTRALNALHRNGDLTGAMTRVEGTTLVALKVE